MKFWKTGVEKQQKGKGFSLTNLKKKGFTIIKQDKLNLFFLLPRSAIILQNNYIEGMYIYDLFLTIIHEHTVHNESNCAYIQKQIKLGHKSVRQCMDVVKGSM